jgi:hypothetical protein
LSGSSWLPGSTCWSSDRLVEVSGRLGRSRHGARSRNSETCLQVEENRRKAKFRDRLSAVRSSKPMLGNLLAGDRKSADQPRSTVGGPGGPELEAETRKPACRGPGVGGRNRFPAGFIRWKDTLRHPFPSGSREQEFGMQPGFSGSPSCRQPQGKLYQAARVVEA